MTASRQLKFFAYAGGEMSSPVADGHSGYLNRSKSWGFQVNDLSVLAPTMTDALSVHQQIG